jgi:CspA family cold shock protein
MQLRGTVKFWNSKGYGFIKPDDGSADVYFGWSAIIDNAKLSPGDKVKFVLGRAQRGRRRSPLRCWIDGKT